ncbi:carbohydrate-binding WSC, partial [Podospora australis]
LGCYTDDTPRVLPHRVDASYIPGGLTPEKCKTVCAEKGYAFAGTEFHEECYCGDAAPSSSVLVGDNECNDPCTGDGTTTCGAAWRVEVYETNAVWKGKGCYVDSGSPRVLPVDKTSAVSGQMTVTKCLEACSGYTFAGVEFGVECWCGGSILETNKAGNEDQCDMQCAGDGGEICGGGNRVSVY